MLAQTTAPAVGGRAHPTLHTSKRVGLHMPPRAAQRAHARGRYRGNCVAAGGSGNGINGGSPEPLRRKSSGTKASSQSVAPQSYSYGVEASSSTDTIDAALLSGQPKAQAVAVALDNQTSSPPKLLKFLDTEEQEFNFLLNGALILLAGACAVTKFGTADMSLWQQSDSTWEVLSKLPDANWQLYEAALATNPVAAKACISGTVYSVGDLMAQIYEGRRLAEFDRARVLRSGLCGFFAHGPLSHYYYELCDWSFSFLSVAPSYQVLLKVGIDQTIWSVTWNSLYYVLLGVLKFESPGVIVQTVRSSWWDLLKAGWRLWPFAHVITYGVVPIQHRVLWVDTVELLWVTILSYYGQQQRKRMEVAHVAAAMPGQVACALPGADGEGGDPAEEIIRGIQSENQIVFEDSEGHVEVKTVEEVYGEDMARGASAGTKKDR